MIKLYTSFTHPNILYVKYIGELTKSDSERSHLAVLDFITPLKNVTIIVEMCEDAVITEKEFIYTVAKNSKLYNPNTCETIIIGLKGIQKSFYKLFIMVSSSKDVKRSVFDTVSEVEKKYHLNFKEDFTINLH